MFHCNSQSVEKWDREHTFINWQQLAFKQGAHGELCYTTLESVENISVNAVSAETETLIQKNLVNLFILLLNPLHWQPVSLAKEREKHENK